MKKKKGGKNITINFEEGDYGIPLSSILGGRLFVAIPLLKEGEAPDPVPPPAQRKEKCFRRPLRLRKHDNYRGRR